MSQILTFPPKTDHGPCARARCPGRATGFDARDRPHKFCGGACRELASALAVVANTIARAKAASLGALPADYLAALGRRAEALDIADEALSAAIGWQLAAAEARQR